MDTLILMRPTLSCKEVALDYKHEHIEYGETELHGGALFDSMEYEEWLTLTQENASEETVHDNWVVSDTYFVVRESDHKIIGMVDIRHSLNAFLASYGGHIGYGVRPTERNKRYATTILSLAIKHLQELGVQDIMLACYQNNEASRRVILKCGGLKEREFMHTDGLMVEVYWIH